MNMAVQKPLPKKLQQKNKKSFHIDKNAFQLERFFYAFLCNKRVSFIERSVSTNFAFTLRSIW